MREVFVPLSIFPPPFDYPVKLDGRDIRTTRPFEPDSKEWRNGCNNTE
jgi:hypothetical protein